MSLEKQVTKDTPPTFLKSFVKTSEIDYGTFFKFENYDFQIGYAPKQPKKPLAKSVVLFMRIIGYKREH
ncbi:hypothetical protein LF65_01620 [Clostridium beijerinckii]|uniref:Uncharacterized protein n=1 Tax=Clostridium beijerinckii TaxID=1520 RepID=A0A0B5QBC6_CLOBE|nr:hypothetical protein [Clostridium beijerinckii]AJG98225.1 hypothetical protein LF65_01620 [Clostridium beijerinckii]